MPETDSAPSGEPAAARPRPPKTPPIIALMAISALNAFAVNVILPALPALQHEFEADYGRVQLILSIYLASMAVSQIFIGPLSDRFGRRPVLLVGFSIFTVASVVAAFATDIDTVILMRVVQGSTSSVGLVLGRAIVRDLYDRRQAASKLGYVTMGLAVAPMLAPLCGGLLHEGLGWRSIFWALAAAGAGCLIVTRFKVPETNLARTTSLSLGTMIRDFGKLCREWEFVLFTICSSLTMGAFFSYLGGVPYVSIHVLGISPIEYGLWFSLMAIGYSLGAFLSGRFAERLGVARMILVGTGLAVGTVGLAIALAAAGAIHPAALFLPMGVMGVSNGLTLPSAITGAISVRPEIAGAAAGLSGAAQIGTGAFLSALTGAIVAGSVTALPLLAIIFAVTVLSFLFAVAIWRRGR